MIVGLVKSLNLLTQQIFSMKNTKSHPGYITARFLTNKQKNKKRKKKK